MRCDLHLHSHHSDGLLSPAALVEQVRAAGVEVMALTDHDTTDGLAEAEQAARQANVRLVPGVELSVTWDNMTIHVLGLGIRRDDATLQAGLAQLVQRRLERAHAMAQKLERRRILGAEEGVRRLAGGRVIGRTHFARFLVREGYVGTTAQAFRQFLARGGAAHVPVCWATLEQAVSWIRGAGGRAAIAHPVRYKLSNGKLRKLLAEFKACGGAALEVVGCGQAPQVTAHCAALAREFGLLASAGSDYHGPEQSWIAPGRFAPLPDTCKPVWHDWF